MALRKTHRSWAQARGVPPVLIDKQLGHAGPEELEVMCALAGSETGRKHYLDLVSELFDAGRSAQAVRDLLDEAMAEVGTEGSLRSILIAAQGNQAEAPNGDGTARATA